MQAVRFARVGTSPEKVPGRGTGPIGIYPIFQGHPGARSPVFGKPARTHLRQLPVGVERTGCRFSPGGEAQNSPGPKHLGYSVFPLRGNADLLLTSTPMSSCRISRAASNAQDNSNRYGWP